MTSSHSIGVPDADVLVPRTTNANISLLDGDTL